MSEELSESEIEKLLGATPTWVPPSSFLQAIRLPSDELFETPIQLHNMVATLDQDLRWFESVDINGVMVPKRNLDTFVSNMYRAIYRKGGKDEFMLPEAIAGIVQIGTTLGFKGGMLLTWAWNIIMSIPARLLLGLKGAKILGLDITSEQVDNALQRMIDLITLDFEGAFVVGIIIGMIGLVAFLALAFRVAPSTIPIIGNITQTALRLFNRILSIFRRLI